jgi:hypothetical protein
MKRGKRGFWTVGKGHLDGNGLPMKEGKMNEEKYGHYYWCIRVGKKLCSIGEIYAFADEVAVKDGVLMLLQKKESVSIPTLIIPCGQWVSVYAASILDGSPVSVVHWKGEKDGEED